jgi:hypothetical protein
MLTPTAGTRQRSEARRRPPVDAPRDCSVASTGNCRTREAGRRRPRAAGLVARGHARELDRAGKIRRHARQRIA